MSAKLLGTVWELELPQHVQPVLLALCDHAKPDGTDCYPSVGRIAWMLGMTDRPVRTVMAWLREQKILVLVQKGGGRGRPARYRIDLDHVARKPPFVAGNDEVGSRVSSQANPEVGSRESGSVKTLLSAAQNPAAERSKTLLPAAEEPTEEPTATNGRPPVAPLVLFSEGSANGGDPAPWMLEAWELALGNGRRLSMTEGRRQKLRAMYAEQLSGCPSPPLAWKAVLHEVKKSAHHMSRRQYQMPESLLRNPERREQWVQEAVQRIERARSKSSEAADFAAEYRRRQQERAR